MILPGPFGSQWRSSENDLNLPQLQQRQYSTYISNTNHICNRRIKMFGTNGNIQYQAAYYHQQVAEEYKQARPFDLSYLVSYKVPIPLSI